MGLGDEATGESENCVEEWTEHPTLRKLLLTIYFGSEVVRITSVGAIALAVLFGAAQVGTGFGSDAAMLWGFVAAVAVVMGADELAKSASGYSVRYGAFLATTVVVTALRLSLGLTERRNSIDDPSALASSLPIESIPVLELYERRGFVPDDSKE